MQILLYLLAIATVVDSCKPLVRDVYIDEVSLLSSDEDSLLLYINNDKYDTSFCKILDVVTGDLSDKISCDSYSDDIMEWASGDVDPTSTQIVNVSSNEMFIKRNNEMFSVSFNDANTDVLSIVNKYNSSNPLHYWTYPSSYTTFIVLSFNGYNVIDSMISVAFVDGNNNNIDNIYKVNVSEAFSWLELEHSETKVVDVFEQYSVMQYPLTCCVCSKYAAAYYHITTANNMLQMNLTRVISDGRIDTRNGRIYDVFLYGNSVTMYDSTTTDKVGKVFDLESQLSGTTNLGQTFWCIVPFILIQLCC